MREKKQLFYYSMLAKMLPTSHPSPSLLMGRCNAPVSRPHLSPPPDATVVKPLLATRQFPNVVLESLFCAALTTRLTTLPALTPSWVLQCEASVSPPYRRDWKTPVTHFPTLFFVTVKPLLTTLKNPKW